LGRPVTPDQVRARRSRPPDPRPACGGNHADQETRKLRLGVSNEEIAKRIMDDATSRHQGQFDRARFESIIRNAGYTERASSKSSAA